MRSEIENALKSSPHDQVNLSHLNIQDSEIREIAEYIVQQKPKIQEIYLNNNLLGDEAGVILGKTLITLPSLSHIDLQFNQLGKTGISAIVALRLRYPRLEYAFHANQISNVAQMQDIEDSVLGDHRRK